MKRGERKKAARVRTQDSTEQIVSCKRSLSPVIATVLLIALVVIIALIIFLWARSFVGEVCQKEGANCEQKCSEINIEASISDGELLVSNQGNVPVESLEIREFDSDGNVNVNREDSINLAPGASSTFEVSSNKVDIVPVITGEAGSSKVEHICESSKKRVEAE